MISSPQNNRVKEWTKLHKRKYREELQLFLIEEEHMIEEAIQADVVETLLILDKNENIFEFEGEVEVVSEQVMSKLSTNQSDVSYIAICKMSRAEAIPCDHVLLLDAVQDPGNLGTLLRSALSFGFKQVVLGDGCVDLYNDKVLRSTQGALFQLNIRRENLCENISDLKKDGFHIYGTSLQEAVPLQNVKPRKRLAVVLGNEGQGVSKQILDLCDTNIKIEMYTFESLNVGVAGSICMYHFMMHI